MPSIEARLIRGNNYTYGGRVFLPEKWEPITAAEHEHLLKSAVDSVTVSGGGQVNEAEFRQKFEFRESGLRVNDASEVSGDNGATPAPKKKATRRRKKATRKRRR